MNNFEVQSLNNHTMEHLYCWIKAYNTSNFLQSCWFYLPHISVYMRVGNKYINGQRSPTIVISNVSCNAPGQGHFKRFITEVEKYAHEFGYQYTQVETVTDHQLAANLEKHGYLPENTTDVFTNFYKPTRHSQRRTQGCDDL